jgi:transketolase
MGLEDLAMMRAIHGTTVLYPCDANQAARLTALAAIQNGISYLRTSRGATPVIYPADEEFVLGGSHVLRRSDDDVAAVIAAGVTVHEALAAADHLAADGRPVTVVDAYSVEPIDGETVRAVARATGGKVVTVEDHRPAGGLGDAVLEALASSPDPVVVEKLAVRTMPGSATPEQQRAEARIDRDAIVETVVGLTG